MSRESYRYKIFQAARRLYRAPIWIVAQASLSSLLHRRRHQRRVGTVLAYAICIRRLISAVR